MKTRHVIGCMTGTSLDGLDAALVRIEGEGLAMRAGMVRCASRGLGATGTGLRRLAEQMPMAAGEIAALMRDFAILHAEAARELAVGDPIDLVCVHGQTVFHKPPVSWQLFQAAPLATAMRCPVVYDLRQADLVAGGQGAPITPIADWILFRRVHDPMAVINLGGFANYTEWFTDLGTDEEHPQPWSNPLDIRGGDICACNQILDALARRRLGKPFDEDGRIAASGVVHDTAFESLRVLLHEQSAADRSLGTGDELAAWMNRFENLATPALLRSACEAIAETIASKVHAGLPLVAAGGGIRNEGLCTALSARFGRPVQATDAFGVPAAHREAVCFAVLGALCQDRVPITIPRITRTPGAAPVAGAWVYP